MTEERLIGVLFGGFPQPAHGPFLEGLGKSARLEVRYAEGDWGQRLQDFAGDLVSTGPDVLVTLDTPAAKAAAAATATIPIVSLVFGAPKPWPANVVALDKNLVPEEQLYVLLALLKENARGTSPIGVLWNADNSAMEIKLNQVRAAAQRQSPQVEIRSFPIRGPAYDVEAATADAGDCKGLIILDDPVIPQRKEQILRAERDHRLPTAYEARHFVDAGGLMSYGPDRFAMLDRIVEYVTSIVEHNRLGQELAPMEEVPSDLFVNTKTARGFGLTMVPRNLAGFPADVVGA